MIEYVPPFPLLVPSFSSKGNLLILQSDGTYRSDNYSLLQSLDTRISKSYLVSAYDIYYGLLPQNPNDWPDTDYLFIDSGGYEINDSFDLSERNKFNYQVFPWDRGKMREIYSAVISCPKFQNSAVILSSYDTTGPFEQQLFGVLSLIEEYPHSIVNFLIKICFPMEELLNDISKKKDCFDSINIIGFTEKELGYTVRERLLNLIRIKRQLISCRWHGRIHIFGGLEPSLVKLYYVAGADIFDGLSWQRMFYRNSASLFNPETFYISLPEHENKFLMMLDNLSILQKISNDLATISDVRIEKMDLLEACLASEELTIKDILTVTEV